MREALTRGTTLLADRDTPALDAEVLLAAILKAQRSSLLAHPERRLGLVTTVRYLIKLRQRRRGVPIAYLTGEQEFYGHSFRVTRATLIPRPDTETLVDTALSTIRAQGHIGTIVDIGTGSGCIAISLALALPLPVIATDINRKALRVARQNAARHGLGSRIAFLKGNLLEPLLQPTYYSQLTKTLIVANLPYLKQSEVKGELDFEPRRALVGGSDGLRAYQTLLSQLSGLPVGACPPYVLLEVHPPTLPQLLTLLKYILPESQITLHHDLTGHPRVIALRLAKNQ